MAKAKKRSNYYVDSSVLEQHWTKWLKDEDPKSWEELTAGIYKICQGVAVNFNPKDADEHAELTHEALVLTLEKIKDGRLKFEPGRAPVFNLLTTTIFRHLYSKKNKESRRCRIMSNYRQRLLDAAPHKN